MPTKATNATTRWEASKASRWIRTGSGLLRMLGFRGGWRFVVTETTIPKSREANQVVQNEGLLIAQITK